MAIKAADKRKRKLRSPSHDLRERAALERTRIRTSMKKWQNMDEAARELGRGLGKRELIDRVAKEVGTTLREVHSALK
jgi:hypothetical protein